MPRRARPDADGLRAWRAFLHAHQTLVDRLDRELVEQHDLPLSWYDVLVQLHEAERELTMGEIAERLLISPSTCTRVVDRMVVAGLVSRRIDPDDARVRHIGVTPSGRGRLRAAAATHLAGIQLYFAGHLAPDASRLAAQFEAMITSARDEHGRVND